MDQRPDKEVCELRERRHRWWYAFTPFKAAFGLGAVAFLIGVLVISQEVVPRVVVSEKVGYYPHETEQRFVVQELQDPILNAVLATSLLTIGGFYYLLRKPLEREYHRSHPHAQPSWDSLSPAQKRLGRVFGYVMLSVIAFIPVYFWTNAVIVWPFREIREFSIDGDRVQLRSVYTSWEITKSEIRNVRMFRTPTRGKVIKHELSIRTRDGREFRTAEMFSNPKQGTLEDQRIRRLFSDLVEALEPRQAAPLE